MGSTLHETYGVNSPLSTQTKKEVDVEVAYGMVASGLVTYDEPGSTIEQGQRNSMGSDLRN